MEKKPSNKMKVVLIDGLKVLHEERDLTGALTSLLKPGYDYRMMDTISIAYKSENSFCLVYDFYANRSILMVENGIIVALFKPQISITGVEYTNGYYFFRGFECSSEFTQVKIFKMKLIDSEAIINPLNIFELNEELKNNKTEDKEKTESEYELKFDIIREKFSLLHKESNFIEIQLPAEFLKKDYAKIIKPTSKNAEYIFISNQETNEIAAVKTHSQSPGDNFVVKAKAGITHYTKHFYEPFRRDYYVGSCESREWDETLPYNSLYKSLSDDEVAIFTFGFEASDLDGDIKKNSVIAVKNGENDEYFNLQVLAFDCASKKLLNRTLFNLKKAYLNYKDIKTVNLEGREKYILILTARSSLVFFKYVPGKIEILNVFRGFQGEISTQVNCEGLNPLFFSFCENKGMLMRTKKSFYMEPFCYTIINDHFLKVKNFSVDFGKHWEDDGVNKFSFFLGFDGTLGFSPVKKFNEDFFKIRLEKSEKRTEELKKEKRKVKRGGKH